MYDDDDDDDEDYDGGHEGPQGAAKGPGAGNAGGNAAGGGGEDLINYKGIYSNDDAGQKYTDPETGAHFEFRDMCKRLTRIMQKREAYEQAQQITSSQEVAKGTNGNTAFQKEKEEFLKSLGLSTGVVQQKLQAKEAAAPL